MCNVCCKEFKGWCTSFTRTEVFLSILEAVLLFIFLGFLAFIILHFIVCGDTTKGNSSKLNDIMTSEATFIVTDKNKDQTTKQTIFTEETTFKNTTFDNRLECTWTPSHKTKAYTHFYDIYKSSVTTIETVNENFKSTAPYFEYIDGNGEEVKPTFSTKNNSGIINKDMNVFENYDVSSDSDGEKTTEAGAKIVLALVKVKPPSDVTFGCILTVISKHWTLTAASCIESIEEMDSLDDFVMMEDYESAKKGRTYIVSDVQIHPSYEGVNRSYDLAALKSEGNLLKKSMKVELPSLLDYYMITIGERLNMYGYGPFRTIDKSLNGKHLRKVSVYSLPSNQCLDSVDSWALRHLWDGEVVERPACGLGPICAGVLYSRGLSCNYCAGTPLVSENMLYGIMSDGGQCGVTCEPQLYVNIASSGEWIHSVVNIE